MTMPKRIGRYQTIKKIGEPGFSDVYLARDYSTDRQVIIKRLREEDLYNKQQILRFQQEAKILAKFENIPIVPIYDFNELDDQPYIVMPYLSGGTLHERLIGKPLPIEQIVPILERIVEALDIAHKNNIVHRDLKPHNILFDEDGKAYLSDFGLSKRLDASRPITTQTDVIVGTVLYMSPEHITNAVSVDGRSDIFSLGIILYEMLTGRHPFAPPSGSSTPNPYSVISAIEKCNFPKLSNRELEELGLPIELNKILQKAMAKNPDDRYDSAGDLANEVVSLQDSVVVEPFKKATPALWHQRAVYWFARKLDGLIFGRTANEPQFNRLKRWASFSILFFGFSLGAFLETPLSKIDPSELVSPITQWLLPPATYEATVIQPSKCYLGPDENYLDIKIVPAGTMVTVLGTVDDPEGEWFTVQGDSFSRCWIQADALSPNNFERVLLFTTVVTEADSKCFGPENTHDEQTVIPNGWRLVAYAISSPLKDWIKVAPHDSTTQCWVSRNSLTEFDFGTLREEAYSPLVTTISPTFTPTFTSTVPAGYTPTLLPIQASWELVSYDCGNRGATGALISLNVSGGQEPYSFSPSSPIYAKLDDLLIYAKPGELLERTDELLIYAKPSELLKITVNSNTSDGEPSEVVSFLVPKANDKVFDCERTGQNPEPAPNPDPPIPEPPDPEPTDPPPEPCWPPGHCK